MLAGEMRLNETPGEAVSRGILTKKKEEPQ